MTTKIIKRLGHHTVPKKATAAAARARVAEPEEFVFNEPTSEDDARRRIESNKKEVQAVDDRIVVLNHRIYHDRQDTDSIEERVVLGRKKAMLGRETRAIKGWLADRGDLMAAHKGANTWPALRVCYVLLERVQRGDIPGHDEIDAALEAVEYIVPQTFLDATE